MKKNENENENETQAQFLDFKEYAQDMYLGYSIATLKERAIPYISDGQKPVQRRILFAMRELGIKSDLPPKKSARVVGDVIGKYHPHGDSSVYEAMVRMSQSWKLRYPLVDGQGNFGSLDGDGAAAMRYTEARLTPIAEEILLSELKLGTVEWKNNYDNTMSEPKDFPSRLNMMLINGVTGIAVGMATDIPSHNLRELTDVTIKAIGNQKISHEEIMEILKGPDFPGGGQVIDSQEDINKIYEEGRGVLRVRAKWEVEKKARGQWQVVVTELPPNVSTAKILEQIHKITSPPVKKDKNGKTIQQPTKITTEKNHMLGILESAKDDSDKRTPIRLVLVPKSSRIDPEEFMNSLIPRIELEQSVKVNLTSVGLDGQPKLKSIKEMILEWIEYRFKIMTKRTQFQLNKVLSRLHILEGRMLAFLNIDRVIEIVKASEDPKKSLMEEVCVSEIQAEDILEIKLRQLAKLEGLKIEKELSELKNEEKALSILLNSKTKMNNLMKKEIESDTKKFEDERRTLLLPSKTIIAKSSDTIADEPVSIILTERGWITLRKGHNIETSTIQIKDGDKIKFIAEGRSVQPFAIIASHGRVYNIKPTDVPSGKGGIAHLNSLIEIGTNKAVSADFISDNDFFIYNNAGYGFVSNFKDLETKNKAGKHFMTMPNEEAIIKKIIPIPMVDNDDHWVSIMSTDDRCLCFTLTELLEMNKLKKGKGYQLIKLPNDVLVKDLKISLANKTYIKDGKNKVNILNQKDVFLSSRARRGKRVSPDNGFDIR